MPSAGPLRRLVLGVDLVAVSDIARAMDQFGDRYLTRIYTPGEIAYCGGARHTDAAKHFAARFAAKEATFKALQAGDVALDWRSVEVVRRPDGSCDLHLHDGMEGLARQRGVNDLRLSLSHDGGFAVAVVAGAVEAGPASSFRIARRRRVPAPLSALAARTVRRTRGAHT
jgi:holo-[acyl-carrier protein] synthase